MIYNLMERSNTEAAYQSFPCFLPFLEERTTTNKFKQLGNITQDCSLPQITENLSIVTETNRCLDNQNLGVDNSGLIKWLNDVFRDQGYLSFYSTIPAYGVLFSCLLPYGCKMVTAPLVITTKFQTRRRKEGVKEKRNTKLSLKSLNNFLLLSHQSELCHEVPLDVK